MAFCRKCGSSLVEGAKFCIKCGTQVVATKENEIVSIEPSAPIASTVLDENAVEIHSYVGEEKTFEIEGTSLHFSSLIDKHIYYKHKFVDLAKIQSVKFEQEYSAVVKDLDSFLLNVPALFSKYRDPIIEAIVKVLIESEIYSVSRVQVEEMLAELSYKIDELYTPIVNEFNTTLQTNQQKKAQNWSMLPNMFFSGIGGIIMGTAINFAVNEMAESSIKNANVTQYQRSQIYKKINAKDIYTAVCLDFIAHYEILIRTLHSKGTDIWIPNGTNSEANGLYTNLVNGMIPTEKSLMIELKLIELNPLNMDYINLLLQNHNDIAGVSELVSYLK